MLLLLNVLLLNGYYRLYRIFGKLIITIKIFFLHVYTNICTANIITQSYVLCYVCN